MQFDSPTILRRYLATFIDSIFIVTIFIAVSYCFNSDDNAATIIRIAVFFGMFFIYEPICTSRFCTVGQKLTGIRVRTVDFQEQISIGAAYIRIIVIILLGLISLLIIPFTKDRRAIHDFAAGSVVIMAN